MEQLDSQLKSRYSSIDGGRRERKRESIGFDCWSTGTHLWSCSIRMNFHSTPKSSIVHLTNLSRPSLYNWDLTSKWQKVITQKIERNASSFSYRSTHRPARLQSRRIDELPMNEKWPMNRENQGNKHDTRHPVFCVFVEEGETWKRRCLPSCQPSFIYSNPLQITRSPSRSGSAHDPISPPDS